MKFMNEMSADKLRGGFYTPEPLVSACYRRIAELVGDRNLHILEPSAGDGAFVRGLNGYFTRKPKYTCIELMGEEAAKCREALSVASLGGEVVESCFFAWAREQKPQFDAVVGNPPFVRYQFVAKQQREDAEWHLAKSGTSIDGVANLWIPFVLISLRLLRENGAFAFVLPSEIFATKSAGLVRSELIQHVENLRVDIYQRGSFPRILQDTIILSGVRSRNPARKRSVEIVEHKTKEERRWKHTIPDTKESWTRFLLTDREIAAYDTAISLPGVRRVNEVASIGVSIVTGANDFFTVDDATVKQYELEKWARLLLARTNDSPGIVFKTSDHQNALKNGNKVWILDFSAQLPNPMDFATSRKYLELGESIGLPMRYKCRIRKPWYRVPDVRFDDLMLSKRAHQSHRLILNKAKAHTTDTIYRGRMREGFTHWKESLVAGFHNSLTILSSEMEGRTYGGGVLELIPSELGRLVVPLSEMKKHLSYLDKVGRDAGGQIDATDSLINVTNELLCKTMPALSELLPDLDSARNHLRTRRFHG